MAVAPQILYRLSHIMPISIEITLNTMKMITACKCEKWKGLVLDPKLN